MDTILLLSPEEDKFERFLTKLGYAVTVPADQMPIQEIVAGKVLDLIILDTAFEADAVELCDFLRQNESTKNVPILCLGNDRAKSYKIRDLGHDKVELMPSPVSIGGLAAKAAVHLRLRKMAGENTSASLAEANAALRDLNARFKAEMEQARIIQRALLPEALPQGADIDLSVSYMPLEEVGGDWYFINKTADDKILAQIADVTGHGLPAAFVGCMTRLALTAADKEKPHDLLRETNRLMGPHLPPGTFVTICAFMYESRSGELSFASGGHPPALVLNRSSNTVKQLKGLGYAIGFFEDGDYSEVTARLEVDDVLAIYTDGITEAQNRNGDQYGIERLAGALQSSAPNATAAEVRDTILGDFELFCDGRILKDDVTLLIMKRTGAN